MLCGVRQHDAPSPGFDARSLSFIHSNIQRAVQAAFGDPGSHHFDGLLIANGGWRNCQRFHGEPLAC